MKYYEFDCVVIGGGAAGMGASVNIKQKNLSVCIIEREEFLGGILMQCIHNGFGLHEFKEELTGPEYAERYANIVKSLNIDTFLNTTVIQINTNDDESKDVICLSKEYGAFSVKCKSIVLAMGCRERNRGNISIPGSRPSGIYTAGLAQRFVNIEGLLPGKQAVIVGSGDIGLIMARRLSLSGVKLLAVVEILQYPSGLNRNIVQCLNDYNIPLYLSHIISKIYGENRIEKVDVTPLIEGKADYSKTFTLDCDTLLLSVGLVPENELSKKAGVEINPQTNGAIVDSHLMTNIKGVFACGNVLHVHDLVDYVTEEAKRAGDFVYKYISNTLNDSKQFKVKPGSNIRYIVPNKFNLTNNKFYLRSMVVKESGTLEIKIDNQIIKKITKKHIQPSEMISFTLTENDFKNVIINENSSLTVSIL